MRRGIDEALDLLAVGPVSGLVRQGWGAMSEVFASQRPHRVGEIVRRYSRLNDAHGNALPHQPLLILGEATKEDWRKQVLEEGGIETPLHNHPYFYFVSTD